MVPSRLLHSTVIACRRQQRTTVSCIYSLNKEIRSMMSTSTTTTKQQLKPTTDLCDDFESTIKVIDPTLGLRNFGGKTHFGGTVVTVKCHEDNSLVKQLAITDGSGKVMVVDGGGSRRRALLGDQVAADCVENKWEGLVIYGSIRDVDEIQQLDLGVQAIGSHPMKTVKRNEGQIGIPLSIGGILITPGEYIVADNNGVVVVDKDPTDD